MRWARFLLMVAATPLASGCLSTRVTPLDNDPGLRPATAAVADPAGRTLATATLAPRGSAMRLDVRASGMRPGVYGIHIHAVGVCAPPDFTSAGPHWNPAGRQHGTRNPAGPHAGDLPNLFIAATGEGALEQMIEAPAALLDADGAAVVIHAVADDYRTDPSGGSGARIACGVLRPS